LYLHGFEQLGINVNSGLTKSLLDLKAESPDDFFSSFITDSGRIFDNLYSSEQKNECYRDIETLVLYMDNSVLYNQRFSDMIVKWGYSGFKGAIVKLSMEEDVTNFRVFNPQNREFFKDFIVQDVFLLLSYIFSNSNKIVSIDLQSAKFDLFNSGKIRQPNLCSSFIDLANEICLLTDDEKKIFIEGISNTRLIRSLPIHPQLFNHWVMLFQSFFILLNEKFLETNYSLRAFCRYLSDNLNTVFNLKDFNCFIKTKNLKYNNKEIKVAVVHADKVKNKSVYMKKIFRPILPLNPGEYEVYEEIKGELESIDIDEDYFNENYTKLRYSQTKKERVINDKDKLFIVNGLDSKRNPSNFGRQLGPNFCSVSRYIPNDDNDRIFIDSNRNFWYLSIYDNDIFNLVIKYFKLKKDFKFTKFNDTFVVDIQGGLKSIYEEGLSLEVDFMEKMEKSEQKTEIFKGRNKLVKNVPNESLKNSLVKVSEFFGNDVAEKIKEDLTKKQTITI